MKILKSAIVAFSLALSMGSVSTAVVAMEGCEDGRECYTPEVAIDNTVHAIIQAKNAIENGDDDAVIIELIRNASRKNKEINANDKLDRKRSTANGTLKKARKNVKAGDRQVASELLKKAEAQFIALKSMI